MEKKKALPRGMRPLLLVIQHLALAIAVCCLITVFAGMGIKDTCTGVERYYSANPVDETDVFEESQYSFLPVFTDHLGDVFTKVVIGSQLGEDGSYNGKSVVDITSYANRKDLAYQEDEITAYYRLEDLLKWYRSGLEYEQVILETPEQLMTAFGREDIKAISDLLREYDINHGLYQDEKREYIELTVIKEKYLSADGRTLMENAQDWYAYGVLSNSLRTAINDLGYNFSLYNAVKDSLLKENTNMRYCFVVEENSKNETVYTNDTNSTEDPESYFKNLGKYAVYHTENLNFETNISDFSVSFFEQKLDRYEYVFGDNSVLYVGVDTSYPAQDIYREVRESFYLTQQIWFVMTLVFVCLVIWLFLLIFLSVMAGRTRLPDGSVIIQPGWFDYIPTEVALALVGGIGFLVVALFWIFFPTFQDYISELMFGTGNSVLHNATILIFVLISIVFTQFWYSLIRRLKMRTIWKNSMCFFICCAIGRTCLRIARGIRRWTIQIGENRSVAGKLALHVVFLGVVNLGLGTVGIVSFYRYRSYGHGLDAYFMVGVALLCVQLGMDILYIYYVFKRNVQRRQIVEGIKRIRDGEMDFQLYTGGMYGENRKLAEAVNSIGVGIKKAVETSMKDERLKADLITNVSHDIKTPLTSIINYVDLLKRENIQEEPVKGYIDILDAKSQRLKQLTDDLVEASKISSGNIVLHMEQINLEELLRQAVGEFSDKFEKRNLTVVENYASESRMILADSRRMWRVMENLFNNVYKYAMEGTRLYIETRMFQAGEKEQIQLSVKNISATPLNISPDELTERFIRGDESRTTEGSGLGLSIAKSLTEVQGGKMDIVLDGDLFKVMIKFDVV